MTTASAAITRLFFRTSGMFPMFVAQAYQSSPHSCGRNVGPNQVRPTELTAMIASGASM